MLRSLMMQSPEKALVAVTHVQLLDQERRHDHCLVLLGLAGDEGVFIWMDHYNQRLLRRFTRFEEGDP